MDTVLATLAAASVPPITADASISRKQLDASLREQAATIKQLVTTQREVITNNIGPILAVRPFKKATSVQYLDSC